MAASVRQDGRFRAVFLSVIMVLMTQVGYTDNMDFSIGLDQDTESKDTGGSTPALTPSVEGADLMVGDLMDDITFQTVFGGYNGSNTSSVLTTGGTAFNPYSPMGNYAYFFYNDGVHGQELWKTDGTTAGTSMVVDLNNGSGHGVGGNKGAHYVHGNTLYYQCDDGSGSSNTKFCKTDGTASGTVILHSNLDISEHIGYHNWAHIGNTVYFLADDGTHGKELWKTDGTSSGTVLVKDINVGAGDITGYNKLLQMVAFENHIYLFSSYYNSAYMNSTSGGLWKSDGTTSGTVFFMPGEMQQLSVIANKLFFRCSCGSAFGTTGISIVASDGTYSGSTYFDALTHPTYDWEFMITGDQYEVRRVKAELNGYAFYGGDDSNGYLQLYKTDGTANGSTKVTNFSNGTELREVSPYCRCVYGQVVGNTLYFQVDDVTTGIELWKTDGTTSGTKIVKDINVGSGDAFPQFFTDYHSIGDTLFFPADDGTHGFELWRTDGTASGTMMVEDLNPNGNSANSWILNAGTSVIYLGHNGTTHVVGHDPANIGGVSSSFTGATCSISPALPTGLSIDSSTCTISGTPSDVTSNTTYTVTANISGTTYQGTVWLSSAYQQLTPSVEGADLLVGDLMDDITFQYNASAASGSGSGSGGSVTTTYGNGSTWGVSSIGTVSDDFHAVVDDTIYYIANTANNGTELVATNTSNGSSWLVEDFVSGSGSGYIGTYMDPIVVGDTIYFTFSDTTYSHELYAHDTSNHSTWQVADIKSGSVGSYPGRYGLDILVGDTIYFSATDGSTGDELWAHDTSNHSTWQVADINSGSDNSKPGFHTAILVGDTLYFDADDGVSGRELWAHDTSNHSTWQVTDNPATNCPNQNKHHPGYGLDILVGDTIYFSMGAEECFNNEPNAELWAHDTSNHSTWQVAEIISGNRGTNPGFAGLSLLVGDTIYFDAHDGANTGNMNGRKVWAHNTSNHSTWLADDIDAGTAGEGYIYDSYDYMNMKYAIDDTIFFEYSNIVLRAYNTSNQTGWDIDFGGSATNGLNFHMQVGDTLYFSGSMSPGDYRGLLLAYDNSNQTGWSPTGGSGLLPDGFGVLIDDTIYFPGTFQGRSDDLWAHQPSEITPVVSYSSSGSGGGMTDVTGATCTVSPALPTGLSIDSNTCTISGTPSVVTSNTTYTVTANISGTTYQGTVLLATMTFGTITSPVMGAELDLGEAMTPITLNYTVNANSGGSSGSSSGSGSGSSSGSGSGNKVATGMLHTCAILDNGDLKCWGSDQYGQLGDDGTNTDIDAPSSTAIDLGPGRTAVDVAAGVWHTCALLDNGDVKCWGSDNYGQLGDGGTNTDIDAPSSTAIDLGPGRTAVSVSAGMYHTCALLDNSEVKCWGRDNHGQLGDGGGTTDTSEPSSTAIDLGPGRTAVAIDAGGYYTCAILDNGELKCWGRDDYGMLGDGGTTHTSSTYTTAPSSTAIDLGPGRTAVAVDAGNAHTCAILDNGELKCWGWDRHGQLGDGGTTHTFATYTTTPSSTAIDLGPGRTAIAVSGHLFHTCALLDNSDLKCWGSDGYGQLGNGGTPLSNDSTMSPPTTPIDFGTNRTPVAVYTGQYHTCAILDNGELKCWGGDQNGQLGDGGSNTNQPSPVAVSGNNTWGTTTTLVTWEIHPELPEGVTLVNGVISGTPSVYAVNQTYTIYANQSGETTTFDMYFSVDTNNPHTVVENQPIDPIGFQGPFQNGTTNWTVSPALPADLVMDPNTGEITGSVNGVLANTTYTVTATHSDGATEEFSFSLQSLADLDGDGLPNELPSDYDAAQGPTSGLVADTDDDADGLDDAVETDTGNYVDVNDTGTDPLDPDTDEDGICDGPNAVPPICIAGPDSTPNGDDGPPTWIGLFDATMSSLPPYKSLPGGTYEIMPELPQSLTMDPNTGVISGTPTQTLENTTFTVWVNLTDGTSLDWNFTIEILADSDGDGLPDELPDDYDSSNPTAPGLVEDLDDDNDGISDLEEGDGLDSSNPDTDGDGICDGVISVDPICVAGPDAFPLDPSADTDTDGDGKPDTITGNSTSVPPLEEDMDDDGDGVEDVNETGTWTYNGPTDTGTDPLNPDTDGDGVCDGPVDVYHPLTGDLICVAGPDTDLGNLAVGAHYALNGSAIESIRPEWFPTGAVWEVSPDLPADLAIDPDTGIISGIANEVTENITYTIYGNGTFSDYTSTFNLQVLEDSDRDGLPNTLPEDYDNSTVTPMVEDLDDDGDGLSDLAETGTGVYNGTSDYGTDSLNPDTDGDGVCDGPNSVWPICINGPDSNPFGTNDGGNIVLVENVAIETPILPPNQVPGAVWEISPALPAGLTLDTSSGVITGAATEVSDNTIYTLWANVSDFGRSDSVALSVMATFGLTVLEDSDGDGMPDELPDDYDASVGTLVEDLDDDNDGMLDTEEDTLGTDPRNPDTDGDGICDGPSAPANGECVAGADAFPFDPSASKDTDGDGMPDTLTGTSTSVPPLVEDLDDDNDGVDDKLESDCDTDPLDAESVPTLNDDGNCKDSASSVEDNDGGFSYIWCFPCLLILLILLLIPMLIGRDRVLGMLLVGPEPENTTSEPEFVGGAGTQEDPFILAPAEGVMPGESVSSTEVITINRMSRIDVDMMDFNQEINGDRFSMYETNFDENGTRVIEVREDGEIIINVLFDDGVGEPTYEGGEFTGLLKLGRASVYLSWTVTVEPDKKKLKEIEKQRKAAEKAEQAEAKKLAKAEAEAKKKAEEEAAALLAEEEEEAAAAALLVKQEEEKAKKAEEAAAKKKAKEEAAAKKKADAEAKNAKAAEAKAEKEAEAEKKAEEEAAAALLVKQEEEKAKKAEEAAAKKKAKEEADAKKAKKAEEAAAKKKADEEAAAAAKPVTKEAKKKEELKRVKANASKIDFKVLGTAKASDKDDLQVIKGIGPFIEEKLNALGIYTYLQISKMTSKLEDNVNLAIEFFPGRVKRDQWVAQAKILLGEDVKIDEKALKKAEELERVAKKAEKIDFATIGVASATDKDNLQELKGIGPFIEEKLNALGIYKFEQIAKMTSDIEDEVNIAIEFFPGRVKRDQWVKQAKERSK